MLTFFPRRPPRWRREPGRVKLILQRTLADYIEGPFWLETATLDTTLHAFQRTTHDHDSYCEGRFAPNGDIYWIRENRAYRGDTQITSKDTFKIAFQTNGDLVTLECDDEESPYKINGTLELDSSITHLDRQDDLWAVTSLERLYKGPLDALQDQGPTTIRTFSLDDQWRLWHTVKTNLYQDDQLRFEAEDQLDWPLWTPRGLLVTQYNEEKSSLLLLENGQKTVLWSGEGEWLRATSWRL